MKSMPTSLVFYMVSCFWLDLVYGFQFNLNRRMEGLKVVEEGYACFTTVVTKQVQSSQSSAL